MKKYILLFLVILLLPINIYASSKNDDTVSGTTTIRQTCIYRNTTLIDSRREETHKQYNYNKFDFSGISGAIGGPAVQIKSYYNVDLGDDNVVFESDEFNGNNYIINYSYDYGIKFAILNFMTNQFEKYKENEETMQNAIDKGEFCPSTVYEITDDNERKYLFCNGYNSELEVETCSLAQEYIKKNYSGYLVLKQELYANTAISNNGQTDISKTDVKDKYVEIEEKKDEVCDKNSESYNLENCKTYEELSDTIVGQADDQGIDEKTLSEYKKIQLKLSEESCDSLLGTPDDPETPAYYLQIVFNIMKYVALILLIILSSMDFLSAVASSDNDALKKAMNKCVKRLIICVIIFFVPTLLEYIFTLLKVYSSSTCGIK